MQFTPPGWAVPSGVGASRMPRPTEKVQREKQFAVGAIHESPGGRLCQSCRRGQAPALRRRGTTWYLVRPRRPPYEARHAVRVSQRSALPVQRHNQRFASDSGGLVPQHETLGSRGPQAPGAFFVTGSSAIITEYPMVGVCFGGPWPPTSNPGGPGARRPLLLSWRVREAILWHQRMVFREPHLSM